MNVYREIRDTYLRYLDTAYWLRSPRLMDERRALLTSSDLLFTDVLVEPVLPYDANHGLLEATRSVGIDGDVAETVGEALFGAYRVGDQPIRLRDHQATAVQRSLQAGNVDGRNVVVTSGTGSGKTESFLLPVLLRLMQEARSLGGRRALSTHGGRASGARGEAAAAGSNAPAAVRALVLYPTNALVEDQITRLRQALRAIAGSPGGRQALVRALHRRDPRQRKPAHEGHATTVVRRRREDLRDAAEEFDSLKDHDGTIDLSQFPDPRQGETADAVGHGDPPAGPPRDQLLDAQRDAHARHRRAPFEATRDWLDEDENVFSLVVDELHLYRGTQGSEVAMIVRNLLDRLGLAPDSPQLRCIATSASLTDDPAGLGFLEQFFGVDRASFFVTPGRPRRCSPLPRLSPAGPRAVEDPRALERHRPSVGGGLCVRPRWRTGQGATLPDLAARLFDEPDDDMAALEVVLDASEHHAAWARVPSRCAPTCSSVRCVGCGHAPTLPATRSIARGPARHRAALLDSCVHVRLRRPSPRASVLLRVRRHQPGRLRR